MTVTFFSARNSSLRFSEVPLKVGRVHVYGAHRPFSDSLLGTLREELISLGNGIFELSLSSFWVPSLWGGGRGGGGFFLIAPSGEDRRLVTTPFTPSTLFHEHKIAGADFSKKAINPLFRILYSERNVGSFFFFPHPCFFSRVPPRRILSIRLSLFSRVRSFCSERWTSLFSKDFSFLFEKVAPFPSLCDFFSPLQSLFFLRPLPYLPFLLFDLYTMRSRHLCDYFRNPTPRKTRMLFPRRSRPFLSVPRSLLVPRRRSSGEEIFFSVFPPRRSRLSDDPPREGLA